MPKQQTEYNGRGAAASSTGTPQKYFSKRIFVELNCMYLADTRRGGVWPGRVRKPMVNRSCKQRRLSAIRHASVKVNV